MFQPFKSLQISETTSELNTLLHDLSDEKISKIHGLNDDDVWESSLLKVQCKINKEHAREIGNKLIFQLSDSLITAGQNTSSLS